MNSWYVPASCRLARPTAAVLKYARPAVAGNRRRASQMSATSAAGTGSVTASTYRCREGRDEDGGDLVGGQRVGGGGGGRGGERERGGRGGGGRGEFGGDVPAERVADDVARPEPEVFDQGRGVGGHVGDQVGRGRRLGTPAASVVEGDD